MNKLTLLLLVIFVILSCEKRANLKIYESELKGKTFSVIWKTQKDTFAIEFRDSTYSFLEYLHQSNTPWRIAQYNNLNFLVLGDRVSKFEKISDGEYNGTYIGQSDLNFKLIERKPNWKKEMIYGTWVEEKYFGTDSTSFPPPPILPNKWNWPPNYIINNDEIELDFYDKFESEIEINNSGEFILMNLKNSNGLGITEELWQIKYLSDSIMIVDKKINDILLSHGEKSLTNIKLIKKH